MLGPVGGGEKGGKGEGGEKGGKGEGGEKGGKGEGGGRHMRQKLASRS